MDQRAIDESYEIAKSYVNAANTVNLSIAKRTNLLETLRGIKNNTHRVIELDGKYYDIVQQQDQLEAMPNNESQKTLVKRLEERRKQLQAKQKSLEPLVDEAIIEVTEEINHLGRVKVLTDISRAKYEEEYNNLIEEVKPAICYEGEEEDCLTATVLEDDGDYTERAPTRLEASAAKPVLIKTEFYDGDRILPEESIKNLRAACGNDDGILEEICE